MKKLISLLLAVSLLMLSTTAFASFTLSVTKGTAGVDDGKSRNYTSSSGTDGENYGTPVYRDTTWVSKYAYLPAFRAGDTIAFTANAGNGNTFNAGEVVTFISSKYDDTYTDTTVQFVDQQTIVNAGQFQKFTYKLRTNLEDGLYQIKIKIGDADAQTFVYLIGTPKVDLLYVDENGTEPYLVDGTTAYCFGKATLSGGANFTQVGAEIGFIFDTNDDGEFTDADVKRTLGVTRSGDRVTGTFQTVADGSLEINGTGEYFFTMAITDVEDPAQLPDVDVYLND